MNSSSPATIRLPIRSMQHLLGCGDDPVVTGGIHGQATEELVKQACSHPSRRGYRILIETASESEKSDEAALRRALEREFALGVENCDREIREKYRTGFFALGFALVAVAALVLLVEWLQAFGTGRLHRIFGESLIIIAWVTLWVPAETLLCDPLPIRRRRKILRALAAAPVSIDYRTKA